MGSIKKDGIRKPLRVVPVGNKLEIIDGRRRYIVAKRLGITEVPISIEHIPLSQVNRERVEANMLMTKETMNNYGGRRYKAFKH